MGIAQLGKISLRHLDGPGVQTHHRDRRVRQLLRWIPCVLQALTLTPFLSLDTVMRKSCFQLDNLVFSTDTTLTNDALQINVTGIAAETWRWVAVVKGLEIAYGT